MRYHYKKIPKKILSHLYKKIPKRIRKPIHWLKWFFLKYGPAAGLRVLVNLSFPRKGIVKLVLPDYKAPVLVRAWTSDFHVFRQIFLREDYKLPLDLDPGFIVDGGANVGYSAIFFAALYPNAKIVSIEPEASNFRLLVENTKAYPNVIPMQAAIWNVKTTLEIENSNLAEWGYRVKKSERANAPVETVTLEEILDMSDSGRIDILKLDIEGAEEEVFASPGNWLERSDILIVELHGRIRPQVEKVFYSAVEPYNYKDLSNGENVILVRE